jgi:RHS repeat-associated protein
MSIVRRCLRPGSAWLTAVLLLMAMVCASMGVAHAAETITYYYTSPQGTVLAKADASGNIISNADYRPYGTQALGTPEQGPGYTGHVNDVDSGLVYMQARYYDPTMGRFLSTDPAAVESASTAKFNRYSYGANNPVLNVDPDGRQTVPLDAYSQHWSNAPADLLSTQQNGNAAFVVFMLTQSDVLDVAPVGSGSGAVASSGFPGEFLAAGAITKGAGLLASAARGAVEGGASSVTGLPRMRLTDITDKGARMQNYATNWTKQQFESHLQANGYTSKAAGPVTMWSDKSGTKVFTTRDFSKSGGPTGELYHSTQKAPVAKFRFDQSPGQ